MTAHRAPAPGAEPNAERITARYILSGATIIEDGCLDVVDGVITHVGPASAAPAPPQGAALRALGEAAILPGQLNAHSHAFQRVIRGETQHISDDHDDFWSWRGRMYAAAQLLTPESMYTIARLVYDEMRLAGITGVGEFHYVHNRPDGSCYEEPDAMADAVIRAALDAGLRVTLLRVAYHEAGPGRPAEGAQRRFASASAEAFLRDTDRLASRWREEPRVNVGVAPHSVRAVPPGWIKEIAAAARERGWPLHIHACEQRQEIAQSIAAYGVTPIELLADADALGPHTTLVHATHLSARDIDLIAERGAIVCACPTTERDLGDGFLPALALLKRGVRLCVGSDSHTVIDPWEELRLIEYHERLRYERRNVLTEAHARWLPGHTGPRGVADLLMPMGAQHGAQSLGQPGGALVVGAPADLAIADLNHAAMRGVTAGSLTSYVALSMPLSALKPAR